jgi:hypothetical protein
MTGQAELRITLDEVAGALELHPFDVVRILGHRGEMPPGLRFTREDVGRVRELAGIERWWPAGLQLPSADPQRTAALQRLLAHALVERDLSGPRSTRADNLLRGLDEPDARRLRRFVNALIRGRVLRTRASWRGLQVSVEAAWMNDLKRVAQGEAVSTAFPSSVFGGGD